MSYFTILCLSLAGVLYGIHFFKVRKYKITKNIDTLIVCIICLGVFLICCLDLPSFVTGGVRASVQFKMVSGDLDASYKRSRHHQFFYYYKDVKGSFYWSGDVDNFWLYSRECLEVNEIRYLPVTRSLLYITYNGREVYNHWGGFWLLVFAGIVLILWEAFREAFFVRK